MSNDKKIAVLEDDFDMDNLADLPSFKAWPTGAYSATLDAGFERKKVGEHDAIELVMTLNNTEELEPQNLSEGEIPPVPGDKCNTLFIMGNEMGQGKFKEVAAPFAAAAGSTKFSAIRDISKGAKVLVIGQRTAKKDDPSKFYFNIVKIGLA